MSKVTKLDDEMGRLSALSRYDILDTGHEERFDRVTKVVEMALNCPITAISLVDADRQWFKSQQGLDVDETPRDVSFCTHTVQNTMPMIVEDAAQDSRFSDNPLVTGDPNIRSYLGVPLLSPDGYNVGTLCAIDTEPRKFDGKSVELLNHLAELVVDELELRHQDDNDALTGALARRAFAVKVQEAILLHEGQQIDSALLCFDVDHFDRVINNFGADAGDDVLCTMSKQILAALRPNDTFARIGDSKFAILMTDTSWIEAVPAADKISMIISGCKFQNIPALKITASLGVSPATKDIKIYSDWFNQIEEELNLAPKATVGS